MAVYLNGVVNGTKLFVPLIKASGEGGDVVNTSSIAAVVPLPGLAAYSAAKYAVRGFTESLRMQLAPMGIGVSCLFPGATRTGMLFQPEDKPEHDFHEEDAGDFQKALWEAARCGVDPLDTGRDVVSAIKENRFYIFTNAEFLPEVRELNREMEAAFPAQDPPASRVKFETMRPELARSLLATGHQAKLSGEAGGFGLDLNTVSVERSAARGATDD